MKTRILLVDDEAVLTRMMKRNLEATGRFEVLDINDSHIAVDAARRFRPDVALLDIMMPGVDGNDVAAAFASDPDLADIPIIFLTATISKTAVEPSGSKVGNYTFLAKPVTFDDVLACINGLLGTVGTVNEFV